MKGKVAMGTREKEEESGLGGRAVGGHEGMRRWW